MLNEAHTAQRDMLIRAIIAKMRHDGCGGRAGKVDTFAPGLDRMAYISVTRFIRDAQAAVSASLKEVRADDAMGKLFGERLVRVFFHSGVLPSRDPDEIAALDSGIDADIAVLDGTVDSDEPIFLAGHTFVRGVCRGP
jgi:hypothetical protein